MFFFTEGQIPGWATRVEVQYGSPMVLDARSSRLQSTLGVWRADGDCFPEHFVLERQPWGDETGL